MLRLKVYGFLFIVLVSCALRKMPPKDVKKITQEIYKESNGELGKTYVFFDDIKQGKEGTITLAYCNQNNIKNFIVVNRDSWKDLSYSRKKLLLAHEFYHCDCEKGHINGYRLVKRSVCATHYMNPYLPSEACVGKYYLQYINQIKKGC